MWVIAFRINSDGDFPFYDRTIVKKLLGEDFDYIFFGVFENRDVVVSILTEVLESSLIVLKNHIPSDHLLNTVREFIGITEDVIKFLKNDNDHGYYVCHDFGNQFYGLQFSQIEPGEDISDIAMDIFL